MIDVCIISDAFKNKNIFSYDHFLIENNYQENYNTKIIYRFVCIFAIFPQINVIS